MQRKIVNRESYSVGKHEGHNDDDIYIGKDFVAVIDGVSNKSSIVIDGKQIKMAQSKAITFFIKESQIFGGFFVSLQFLF